MADVPGMKEYRELEAKREVLNKQLQELRAADYSLQGLRTEKKFLLERTKVTFADFQGFQKKHDTVVETFKQKMTDLLSSQYGILSKEYANKFQQGQMGLTKKGYEEFVDDIRMRCEFSLNKDLDKGNAAFDDRRVDGICKELEKQISSKLDYAIANTHPNYHENIKKFFSALLGGINILKGDAKLVGKWDSEIKNYQPIGRLKDDIKANEEKITKCEAVLKSGIQSEFEGKIKQLDDKLNERRPFVAMAVEMQKQERALAIADKCIEFYKRTTKIMVADNVAIKTDMTPDLAATFRSLCIATQQKHLNDPTAPDKGKENKHQGELYKVVLHAANLKNQYQERGGGLLSKGTNANKIAVFEDIEKKLTALMRQDPRLSVADVVSKLKSHIEENVKNENYSAIGADKARQILTEFTSTLANVGQIVSQDKTQQQEVHLTARL